MAELARISHANTKGIRTLDGVDDEVYRCQYTDLVRVIAPIGEFEPGQYVAELRSRNIGVRRFVTVLVRAFW